MSFGYSSIRKLTSAITFLVLVLLINDTFSPGSEPEKVDCDNR